MYMEGPGSVHGGAREDRGGPGGVHYVQDLLKNQVRHGERQGGARECTWSVHGGATRECTLRTRPAEEPGETWGV